MTYLPYGLPFFEVASTASTIIPPKNNGRFSCCMIHCVGSIFSFSSLSSSSVALLLAVARASGLRHDSNCVSSEAVMEHISRTSNYQSSSGCAERKIPMRFFSLLSRSIADQRGSCGISGYWMSNPISVPKSPKSDMLFCCWSC